MADRTNGWDHHAAQEDQRGATVHLAERRGPQGPQSRVEIYFIRAEARNEDQGFDAKRTWRIKCLLSQIVTKSKFLACFTRLIQF
jgi:hypothetical protein